MYRARLHSNDGLFRWSMIFIYWFKHVLFNENVLFWYYLVKPWTPPVGHHPHMRTQPPPVCFVALNLNWSPANMACVWSMVVRLLFLACFIWWNRAVLILISLQCYSIKHKPCISTCHISREVWCATKPTDGSWARMCGVVMRNPGFSSEMTTLHYMYSKL